MNVPYPFAIKHTTVTPDVNLAWCDEGEGAQTLLFVHGLAGYLPLWKHQIQNLKSDYRCVAVDLPGNGKSPSGAFPYSIFFYAEVLARFIEKEQLRRVVLCGHSMGGHISMIIALRYPHLIESLVLIAPSGLESFAPHEATLMLHLMEIGQWFYANSAHLEPTIRKSFYTEHPETAGIVSDLRKLIRFHKMEHWNKMISALIKSMLNEQIGNFLPNLGLPVLILFGAKDEFIPNKLVHPLETTEKVAYQGASKMKQAQYHIVPRAGHFVHIEQHQTVNNHIRTFLKP